MKTHTNERKTRRNGLTNLASIFSVIPRMIGSSTKRLERLSILRCEAIPRLPKSSDCRRIESGENGEESVVIVQEEETLSIENDISSDSVTNGMAGITHLAEFDKVLDQRSSPLLIRLSENRFCDPSRQPRTQSTHLPHASLLLARTARSR